MMANPMAPRARAGWLARPLLLALALPLAGCFGMNTARAPQPVYSAQSTAGLTTQSLVPVTGAGAVTETSIGEAIMLLPEESGALKEIKERHYPNGTKQEIFLDSGKSGAGDNILEVSVQTAAPRDGRAADLQLYRPSEQGIRNEIIGRFPDVRMNLVTRPSSNSFGPVGLAIGRHPGGASCVFAWQWIDNIRDPQKQASGMSLFGQALSGRSNNASVRIRLCSRQYSVDQLVAQIESLRMGDRLALDRIMKLDRSRISSVPTRAVAGGGSSGSVGRGEIVPVSGSLESLLPRGPGRRAAAAPVEEAERPVPRRRTVRRAPREEEPVDEGAREREWQRRSAAIERSAPRSRQEAWVDPTQSRYLAPVQGAPALPAGRAVQPAQGGYVAPAQGGLPRQQLMNLPPEAYRGPSAQRPVVR
jgi:hypothetical protein